MNIVQVKYYGNKKIQNTRIGKSYKWQHQRLDFCSPRDQGDA